MATNRKTCNIFEVNLYGGDGQYGADIDADGLLASRGYVFDVDTWSWVAATPSGTPASTDSGYQIADVDSSTPAYYGYTKIDGGWYIMKEDSGSYRYAKGTSGYSTAWTDRASQTYDYFDVAF